jgi:hypothetical protein
MDSLLYTISSKKYRIQSGSKESVPFVLKDQKLPNTITKLKRRDVALINQRGAKKWLPSFLTAAHN